MKTQCSHCRAKFNVADQHKGQRARCSKCGQPFVIAAIQESKPVEICSHCLRTIGADEQMHVFESKIVCGDCDVKLRSRPTKAKPAGSISAAGPAPGSERDTTNGQQRRYVPMADEASLLPWVAARRLNVAGPVNPDASTVWATMIGWLARGDGVGFRYAWHIILWAIVLEWLLLPAAVALTCGLGALFLVPQLITAFLAMYLRLLYGKATSLRNLFDGFKLRGAARAGAHHVRPDGSVLDCIAHHLGHDPYERDLQSLGMGAGREVRNHPARCATVRIGCRD